MNYDVLPVDISGTIVGDKPDCLLLSGTVVGENPDHVCWAYYVCVLQPACYAIVEVLFCTFPYSFFFRIAPTPVRHISSVEGGAAASMMTNKLDKRKDSP